MNTIVLVDGKNALYRHHFANMVLADEEGFPTGALHGCLQSLVALSKRLPDASFVWVWDGEGETWRHKMMNTTPQLNSLPPEQDEDLDDDNPVGRIVASSLNFLGVYGTPSKRKKPKKIGYKANRIKGVSDEKKRDKFPTDQRQRALLQLPILRLILDGSGFRNYQVQGLEGDDLIAMLAKRIIFLDEETEVIIHSGDRDFYQLLAWPQIKILLRLKEGKLQWAKKHSIEEEYQVKVRHWTKYRALTGDQSDNIPHLWKVGPVTAKKMLADGLDPSNHDYQHISKDIQLKYSRYFQPHGIEKMWSAVYGNYKLCQLVADPDSLLLSEDVRYRSEKLFEDLTSMRKFRRRESLVNPDSYRKVGFLLNQYQLSVISGRLDEFWAIK